MSTHARPLAVWLAASSDSHLASLFAAREVRPDAAWQDFFDAAEALLEPASIDRILPKLTRAEAASLWRAVQGADAGAERAALTALALLRADGTPPPPVAEAVATRADPMDAASAGAEQAGPEHTASDQAAAHAAERAFTTVAALADALLAVKESPLALLAGGGVGAGEKKRLIEAGVPADDLDDIVALAEGAGLLTPIGRRLQLTAPADEWLRLPAVERWGRLAEGFRAALPRGLSLRGGGWPPISDWDGEHPWDDGWPQRNRMLQRRARMLGLIADGGTEPEWAVPLREGSPIDPEPLRLMLPAEVDRVFLQNDLSAIAPGPLAPSLDVRLRAMAVRESAAQASSYRFSAESITHALAAGETGDSILAFLGGLSLTGIPQPLEYLVTQTSQRHGLIRVWTAATERTRISSADPHLLDALAVDQSLRPLGLVRDGDELTSRVGRDTVYWALTDARYPATIVDADGRSLSVDRHPAAAAAPQEQVSYDALIARLRSRQGPDADAAWLARELEAAVRTRATVLIEVGMPDGSTRALILEANGLGGGRLRGRDRQADVERTLPVSSIRSARVVDPSAPVENAG